MLNGEKVRLWASTVGELKLVEGDCIVRQASAGRIEGSRLVAGWKVDDGLWCQHGRPKVECDTKEKGIDVGWKKDRSVVGWGGIVERLFLGKCEGYMTTQQPHPPLSLGFSVSCRSGPLTDDIVRWCVGGRIEPGPGLAGGALSWTLGMVE